MSIDLHIHSKNSDGTDSIDEIVSKSKDQQLQAISITDHEYLSEVNAEGIEIISGVYHFHQNHKPKSFFLLSFSGLN